ncbi:MAG: hypothetical protein M1840_003869 [Geoglossum simile]|nr:MAG: hypothetical protein M1840_003869 [Geoglossum simile]
MASPLKEKGKASTSGTVEPDCGAVGNGGLVQTDSAPMASKLAASASGLTRSLLGIGAAPGDAANVLTPNGTPGKSQNPLSNGPGASSARTDSSCASRVGAASLAGGITRCKQPFRTEPQQEQESEQDFANFLESQPVQDLELPPTITQSYRLSRIGETIVPGQQSTTKLAQRARGILVANDVNPKVFAASQFQSFQEQDTNERQRSIRSYVRNGKVAWNPENANGLNDYYHQRNPQTITPDHILQPESVLAQRARSILVINDINPDLLTASQFLSFQHEDLNEQKQLIRTCLNGGTSGNGWTRQALHETHVGQEQPNASRQQDLHAPEPHLQLHDQQDSPHTQQHHHAGEPKAASLDPPSERNVEIGQMNTPAQKASTAQQAIELLVANGINPELFTASQLFSFQQQNLGVQQKGIEVYLQNIAHHKISIGRQEERHASLQGEDGAAVVALLSQPKFLDLVDTYQDDEGLHSISSLDLTSPQANTIERFKALFPAAPVHNPPPPTHVLNLPPIEALIIPPSWDSRNADVGSADFADHADRRQQWLRDWDGFLRAYADEVWGDLLPLVEEAREELEEAKENDRELRREDGAVRRLAMVLGHLRDDKFSQKG